MRAVVSMVLLSMCIAALPADAANSLFDQGIELRDVTLTHKMHFLGGFDSPFTYALSPERMRFAYVPALSGGPSDEVRVSDIRGRDPVAIHAPAPIVRLAWAPHGGPIAFVAGDRIWLVQPDGTGLHRVADYGGGLAWSPDSKELALDGRELGTDRSKISVLTIATGDVRDVAEGSGPSWSPDGSSLLYSWSDNKAHQVDEIRVVPALGGSPRTIAHGWAATWSPDGRRIAYVSPTRTSPAGVWVMRTNGGEGSARLLTRRAATPTWLPGSRSILLQEEHRSNACGYRTTLSIVPAAGGKISRLLVSRSAAEPLAWNPKGRKLMYFKYVCP